MVTQAVTLMLLKILELLMMLLCNRTKGYYFRAERKLIEDSKKRFRARYIVLGLKFGYKVTNYVIVYHFLLYDNRLLKHHTEKYAVTK